jgi:hypothetical protein
MIQPSCNRKQVQKSGSLCVGAAADTSCGGLPACGQCGDSIVNVAVIVSEAHVQELNVLLLLLLLVQW